MGLSAEEIMAGRLPDTDTPPETTPETPPAPAGTPERLYAGKYKTVEEMEAAYGEAQRKITEEAERGKRLEALLFTPSPQQFAPPVPQPPPAPAYQPQYDAAGNQIPDYVSRAEAERIADERAQRYVGQTMQGYQAQQQWRETFWRDHPDLKDSDMLVKAVYNEVAQRYAYLPPDRLPAAMPLILDETAKKTREEISRIKATARAEIQRADAQRAAGQTPGTTTPPNPTPPRVAKTLDDLRADAIAEEMERYRRATQPLPSPPPRTP